MTHIIEKKRPDPKLLELLRKRAADIIAISSIGLLLISTIAFAGYVGLARAENAYEVAARV
jgi:hypothetical protein